MIYNPKVVTPKNKTRVDITNTIVPIILFHHTEDIDRFAQDYVQSLYGPLRFRARGASTFNYVTVLLTSTPGIYTVNKKYEISNLAGGVDTLYIRVFDITRYRKNNEGYIAWGVWGASDVREL